MSNGAPVTVTVAEALADTVRPHEPMPKGFTHWWQGGDYDSSGVGHYVSDPECRACQDVERDRTLLRLLRDKARELRDAYQPTHFVNHVAVHSPIRAAEAEASLDALLGPAPGDGDGGDQTITAQA